MITHEEARQLAFDMLPKSIGSESSRRKLHNYFELDIYFIQQEKVSKLLELYQEREKSRVTVDGFLKSWELTKQIQALEEELK